MLFLHSLGEFNSDNGWQGRMVVLCDLGRSCRSGDHETVRSNVRSINGKEHAEVLISMWTR